MPLKRKQLVAELLGSQTSERIVDTAERFSRGLDRAAV